MTPITSQTTTIMAPIFMLHSCREESPLGAVNPDGIVPSGRAVNMAAGKVRPARCMIDRYPGRHMLGARLGGRVEPIDHPTRQLMDGVGCFQCPVGTWENPFRGARLGLETEGFL